MGIECNQHFEQVCGTRNNGERERKASRVPVPVLSLCHLAIAAQGCFCLCSSRIFVGSLLRIRRQTSRRAKTSSLQSNVRMSRHTVSTGRSNIHSRQTMFFTVQAREKHRSIEVAAHETMFRLSSNLGVGPQESLYRTNARVQTPSYSEKMKR